MIYKEISGIKMSSVCMGCWNISGDWTWGGQDENDSIEAIKASVDNGVNFFDTAEIYGDGYSESLLGKVLAPVRNEVVIATKTLKLEPERLIKSCEDSLRRLKTDYIDVFYLHWPDSKVPIEDSAAALEKLQAQGKIKMSAVSNFGPSDIRAALEHIPLRIDQFAYNLLFRAAEYDILPACMENNVAAAAYSPLAEGLLTGKFASAGGVPEGRARTRHFPGKRPRARHGEDGFEIQTFDAVGKIKEIAAELSVSMAGLSLAWVLQKPGVGFAVAGARNAEQARMNARASAMSLGGEVTAELDKITLPLKGMMGPNPDMWEHNSRMR